MEDSNLGTVAMEASGSATTGGSAASELPKDTLIFVKSKSVGTDSKGRTKVDLRFSAEETQQIIEELSKIKERVKIQLHYNDDTAFIFVKEVQERGETFSKKATGKTSSVSTGTSSRIAALKGK